MSVSQQLVTRVDFVGLSTRDLERAVGFYGETLGLPRSVYLPERGYSEFETGNLTLSVFEAERMGLEHRLSRNAIALHVDDVEAARAELEGRRGLPGGHARHRCLPHGVFLRPGRERAHAPPPVHAAHLAKPQGAPAIVNARAPHSAPIAVASAADNPRASPYVSPAANESPQP